MDYHDEREFNHRTVAAPSYIIALLQKDYEAVITHLGQKNLDIKEKFYFTEENEIQEYKKTFTLGNIMACDKNIPKEIYEKVHGNFDFYEDFEKNPLRKGRWNSVTNLTETTEVIRHIAETYPDLLKGALSHGMMIPIKFEYYERDLLQKKVYSCFFCQMHKSLGKDIQDGYLLASLFRLPELGKARDISRYREYISLLRTVFPFYCGNDQEKCSFFISAFTNASEIIHRSRELKCVNNPAWKEILALLKECYLSLENKDVLFSRISKLCSEEAFSSFCFCLDTFVDVEVKLNLFNKDVLNPLLKCMQKNNKEDALTIMNCVESFENLSMIQNDAERKDIYSKMLLGMIETGNIEIVVLATHKGLVSRDSIDELINLSLRVNQLKVVPALIALKTESE